MSGERRGPDPVDDAITKAGGAVAGLLITGWLGLIANSARKKHLQEMEEQRQLKLPVDLESSRQDPIAYFSDKSGRQGRATANNTVTNGQTGDLQRIQQVGVIAIIAVIFVTMFAKAIGLGIIVALFIGGGMYVARRALGSSSSSSTQLRARDARELIEPITKRVPLKHKVYTLKLPPKSEWQPVRAGEFMATLLERFTGLAFQIEATQEQVRWRILDLRCNANPQELTTAIESFYPQVEIVASEETQSLDFPLLYRFIMHFEHLNDFYAPMKRASDLKLSDPLIAMTQEMSALQPGERIVFSLYVADYARFAREQALNFVLRKVPKNPLRFLSSKGIFEAIAESGLPPEQDLIYSQAETNLFGEKLLARMYLSFLMVQVDAPTRERVLALSHFDGHVRQLDNLPYNGLTAYAKPTSDTISEVTTVEQDAVTRLETLVEQWASGDRDDWRQHPLILDSHEIAALWHLPYADFTSPRIEWGKTRVFVPMPADAARNQQGICLGYNGSGERAVTVYMPLENRTTHTAIIGRTGTGKSTLLHNLIHQDIAAGRGVAVIDPHGTLVREVLERSIPPEREDDVVLLDFAQKEYPPPLNPLVLPEGTSQHDAAGAMMTTIQQIYRGFEGQMADTLYMTLLTLMQDPQPTLRDVTRLYNSSRYRDNLAEKLDNPAAEDFWTVFNRLSPGEQEQRRSPVEHRMRAFYGNPALYPVLCHPQALDITGLIRERKVILVSLEAKRVGIPPRDQQLLGAVLVAQIQQAVMGHAAKEHGFALYVDEAEEFVTTSLPELLSQARFANLSLILANQYLKQLAGDTLEAVMANVGAIAAFQCYEPDARALLPYLRPYYELDDLLNVDVYQAALWMRVGQRQTVMSLTTQPKPPLRLDGSERYARIRTKSIANYTPMSRTEVLAWLGERYPKTSPALTDEEQWYDKA